MPIYAKNKVSRRDRAQVPAPRPTQLNQSHQYDRKLLKAIPPAEWDAMLQAGTTLDDVAQQIGVKRSIIAAYLAEDHAALFRRARVAQAHHLASDSVSLIDEATFKAEAIALKRIELLKDSQGNPILDDEGKPREVEIKGDPAAAMVVLRAAHLRSGGRQWLASRYDRDTYGESTAANGPVNLGNIFNVVLQEVQREKAQPLQVIDNKG